MKNEKRTKKVTFALEWLTFCGKCLETLKEEIKTDAKTQDDVDFGSWEYITIVVAGGLAGGDK